jgi:adenylate kinase
LIIDIEVPVLQLIKRLVARGKKENRISYKTNTESIVDRLEDHEIKTLPVVSYYKKDRDVTVIDGSADREEIFDSLCNIVENAFRKVR